MTQTLPGDVVGFTLIVLFDAGSQVDQAGLNLAL